MSLAPTISTKQRALLANPSGLRLGFWELIKIAFRDHLIDRIDHAVIKRLRGLA